MTKQLALVAVGFGTARRAGRWQLVDATMPNNHGGGKRPQNVIHVDGRTQLATGLLAYGLRFLCVGAQECHHQLCRI